MLGNGCSPICCEDIKAGPGAVARSLLLDLCIVVECLLVNSSVYSTSASERLNVKDDSTQSE
jgi:hypothetical protein